MWSEARFVAVRLGIWVLTFANCHPKLPPMLSPSFLPPPSLYMRYLQWKSLIRQHAQLVVADRQLAPRFERECYSYFPPKIGQPPYVAAQQRQWVPRTCVSGQLVMG